MKRLIAKICAPVIYGIAMAFSIGTVSIAQMTEAEQAAESERGLTAVETVLKQAACALNFGDASVVDLPDGVNASAINLPPNEVLLIAWAMERQASSDNLNLSIFPYLPVGGIGYRDYCDLIYMFPLPPLEQGWPLLVIGLRLRPGLDIETDYPTAYAQIQENDQHRTNNGGKFAIFEIDILDSPDLYYRKFEEVFAQIEQSEMIDRTRSALVLGETRLLVPIK